MAQQCSQYKTARNENGFHATFLVGEQEGSLFNSGIVSRTQETLNPKVSSGAPKPTEPASTKSCRQSGPEQDDTHSEHGLQSYCFSKEQGTPERAE